MYACTDCSCSCPGNYQYYNVMWVYLQGEDYMQLQ